MLNKIILGMLIVSIVLISGCLEGNNNIKEASCNDLIDLHKILNESYGKPNEYTCNQIAIMIQSNIYPRTYEGYILDADVCSLEKGRLIEQHWDNANKEDFVDYYLLNCLEKKK